MPMLSRRTVVAQTNFKLAIERVRVTQLMEKDADVGWLAGFALDILGLYVGTTITSQLKKLRAGGQRALSKLAAAGRISDQFESWGPTAYQMLSQVTDKQFDVLIKPGIDKGKQTAKSTVRSAANRDAQTQRDDDRQYLDVLTSSVDVAFQELAEATPTVATDIELLAMFDGFEASLHQLAQYEAAVRAKVARYRKSGVPAIGRKEIEQPVIPGVDFMKTRFYGDTRVVLVSFKSGAAPRFAFEQQERARGEPDRPGSPFARDTDFGSAGLLNFPPKLARLVPTEFQEVAVARHRAAWGGDPPVIQIDDSKRPGALPDGDPRWER